jgi:hypothetical protein
LPVRRGYRTLHELRARLIEACDQVFDHVPTLGITVARSATDEMGPALDEARASLSPLRIALEKLAVLRQREDGLWWPQECGELDNQ